LLTTSPFSIGDRVFSIKFGNGNVSAIEGNALTTDFDRAGQKRVLDGSVERVCESDYAASGGYRRRPSQPQLAALYQELHASFAAQTQA
jgi:hypothetical protein